MLFRSAAYRQQAWRLSGFQHSFPLFEDAASLEKARLQLQAEFDRAAEEARSVGF